MVRKKSNMLDFTDRNGNTYNDEESEDGSSTSSNDSTYIPSMNSYPISSDESSNDSPIHQVIAQIFMTKNTLTVIRSQMA